jgi:hypothetical protein
VQLHPCHNQDCQSQFSHQPDVSCGIIHSGCKSKKF